MQDFLLLHIIFFAHCLLSSSLTDIPKMPNMIKSIERHFIFGYGSLMCHRSRAITSPSLALKPAIPVVVEHLSRTWSARISHKKNIEKDANIATTEIDGQTAMGIERVRNKKCSGVLIEVDTLELKHFDAREGGYDRVEIDLRHVWGLVDELDGEAHAVLQQASYKRTSSQLKQEVDDSDVETMKVWVYIPQTSLPANRNYPIVQSYVDIIVRGCLEYNTDFVTHFLNTTHGWWYHHNAAADIDQSRTNINDGEFNHFVWVEDRGDPLYVRADMDWSKNMAGLVDQYLKEHLPLAFTKRKPLDLVLSASEKYVEEFD